MKTTKTHKKDDVLKVYKEYLKNRKYVTPNDSQVPPSFTLDQKIENINPYYIRCNTVKYG